MQRKQVDYKSVLSLFLPQGILDYFDIVDYSDMGSYYLISLEERKVIPLEHSHMKLVSKGFFPDIIVCTSVTGVCDKSVSVLIIRNDNFSTSPDSYSCSER